ncbi:hypothetical protein BTUL_0011g00150 [Botrytis tulipae]|uniref:Uncharacterized protein n=1 Tax=Botrytis tulipae TaxID=87230 RepID=A0A4Z1F676_9HELO|nr:hypothetical protein BTUL_0011g00150 [Botrytis tulipae]
MLRVHFTTQSSLKHCYGKTYLNDSAMEKQSFWSYVNNQLFSYSLKQAPDRLSLDQTITLPENKPFLRIYLDEDHACGVAGLPESWDLFEQWKKIMGLIRNDEEVNNGQRVSGFGRKQK